MFLPSCISLPQEIAGCMCSDIPQACQKLASVAHSWHVYKTGSKVLQVKKKEKAWRFCFFVRKRRWNNFLVFTYQFVDLFSLWLMCFLHLRSSSTHVIMLLYSKCYTTNLQNPWMCGFNAAFDHCTIAVKIITLWQSLSYSLPQIQL